MVDRLINRTGRKGAPDSPADALESADPTAAVWARVQLARNLLQLPELAQRQRINFLGPEQ